MATWNTTKLPNPVSHPDADLTPHVLEWAYGKEDELAGRVDSMHVAFTQYRALSTAKLDKALAFFNPDSDGGAILWIDASGTYQSKLML